MAQEHATIVDLMQRGPCKAESSFKYFLTHIHSALLLLQETRCRFDNIDRDSKNLTFHHYQATDLLGLSQRHLSMSY
ncbi:hypothetical protein FOXYSP1_04167 [Fusarium oxysporum f. sp. phaseoli]